MADKKRAFVTGWPVDHSRSPLIHSYWLNKHGIDGEYIKRPCKEEELPVFFASFDKEGFVGGNVTVPNKEAAFAQLSDPHEAARVLGAANTVWLKDGKLMGTNTDGYGFLANLDDQLTGWDSPENRAKGALVLGAGGASRAIIYSLQERGFEKILIANRTLEKAETLVKLFGAPCEAIELTKAKPGNIDPGIIVNTTSIGMNDGKSPLDLTGFASSTIVHDIVYTPLITPLLAQAKSLGMPIVDGLGMLLHQAVPGFEKWFGVRPEVDDDLRNILLEDLGEAK